MPKMSPSDLAAKWAKNFGGSADAYKKGIQGVQGNPAQLAIQAQDRLLSGFTDAVTSGRWAAGLQKVTEAGWKQAAMDKGANALATSARLAQDKVMRAEQVMGPIRDQVVNSLPARGDIEQNLQRAYQMAKGMHEARKRG